MREKINALQQLVVNAVSEKKAFDVLILDLRERSDLTDCFILCSANSKVHVQSIADAIIEKCHLKKIKPLGIEGYSGGYWVVIDLGDLIGHIFHKEARLHYDLERLWGDVPVIRALDEQKASV